MTLSSGSRLGPYEILSPLGAGGMGEVYRARDTRIDREVAVKVLPESLARDADALSRFEREARAVGALSHPNILALHEFGSHEGTVFAVTELLEGATLRSRLAAGALPARKAVDFGVQITNGLAAAHDRGIIHRDLKPENLFVTNDGRIKILDFGLARFNPVANLANLSTAPTAEQKTEPGTVMGTVGYMSPEQVRGTPVDHRSDIFSFGSVLYEMLTGERAFRGGSAVETMSAILNGDPPDTAASGKAVPPDLDRIVRHCLEKSVVERFQSARDVAFDLQSHAGVSVSASGRAQRQKARPTTKTWALAAGAILVSILSFWAGRRSRPGASPLDDVHAHRVTFARGRFATPARFAPDGQNVVYTAAWENRPPTIFATRLDSLGEHPFDLSNAESLAVSQKGELALLVDVRERWDSDIGTLARQPLSGGAPRKLVDNVVTADWAPNGEDLAIVREMPDGNRRVEYPIGHLLVESPFPFGVRVSPDGDSVAVLGSTESEKGFSISLFDRKGKSRVLTKGWFALRTAWSPSGRELVFSGYRDPGDVKIGAVDLSGRERILLPAAGLVLNDVSRDGRILADRANVRNGILFQDARGAERDLSWMHLSWLSDISRDGRNIVFSNGSTNSDFAIYLRSTDGSSPVRLGEGENPALSPDGRWVLARRREAKSQLVLLPTGAGSARTLAFDHVLSAGFLPDGRILVIREQEHGKFSFSVTTPAGSPIRPVDLSDISLEFGVGLSPDGLRIAYANAEGRIRTVPFDGGQATFVSGKALGQGDEIVQWSDDGKVLFVWRAEGAAGRIDRIQLATGERSPWREVRPRDATGVVGISDLMITPDGKSLACDYRRAESSGLFILDGLLTTDSARAR